MYCAHELAYRSRFWKRLKYIFNWQKAAIFILLFIFLFHFIFADRLVERSTSSDKNVELHSAPQNHPPEDPFGSVPFISHPGKLHYVTFFVKIPTDRRSWVWLHGIGNFPEI